MTHAIRRREALRLIAGGAASACLPAAPASRPNILFLFADDMRFGTLRALDNPEVETPNLDRLVAGGTAFTHACIMGGTIPAICAPSRAMLMTGQSLFHIHRSIIAPKDSAPADRDRPFEFFTETLRKAGYSTFGTGKWHIGPKLYARAFDHGENIFFGGMCDHDKVPVHDFDPTGEYPQSKRYTAKGFSSEIFSDSAIKFLRAQKPGGKPFCAMVNYTAPHDPRMAPKEYADMYDAAKIAIPKNFLPEHPFDNGELKVRDEMLAPHPRTPDEVRRHIAAYYAMITHLDHHIGRVLKALEETGHAKNTIVVFAADNGLAVGQHGLLGKQNLYDHSCRVPLVIAGPGLPKNQRAAGLCYLLDIHPTLCELTGVRAPATVEGISLVPALKNPQIRLRSSVLLAYRHFQRGVRTKQWKLIKYNVGGKQTTQLFDLDNDPWEMKNLAGSKPDLVGEMTGLLADWMKKTDDFLDLEKPDWGWKAPAA